jgi:hypothetical protein
VIWGLVVGVAGAALLSGVVLMEAGLVAPLATACEQSPACLASEGAGVAEALAALGWRNVDPLTWAGGPLATGLLLLGLAGGLLRTLGSGRRRCWSWPPSGCCSPTPGCMLRRSICWCSCWSCSVA